VVHEIGNGLDRRLASLRIPFIVVGAARSRRVFVDAPDRGGRRCARAGDALVADVQRRSTRPPRGSARPKPRVLFIIGRRPGQLADLIAIGQVRTSTS
jgi:hypothetical protein